jgi:hypothetical protein
MIVCWTTTSKGCKGQKNDEVVVVVDVEVHVGMGEKRKGRDRVNDFYTVSPSLLSSSFWDWIGDAMVMEITKCIREMDVTRRQGRGNVGHGPGRFSY